MTKKQVYMRAPCGQVFGTYHPEYHQECENLGGGGKGFQARREYARSELRKRIKPGDTVYCIVRSVSKSGLSRVISLYIVENGKLRNIDGLASDAMARMDAKDRSGFVVHGCGMDMCFATVYDLGRYLYPDGFGVEGKDALGRIVRPLTKQKAENAVRRGFVFRGRNGDSSGWDCDGGYSLKHQAL